MKKPKPYTKSILDMGDNETAIAIHLPTDPYGVSLFWTPNTAQADELMDNVSSRWEELWPKIRTYLEKEMKEYRVASTLGKDKFVGMIEFMTPDVYLGEESDYRIIIEFNKEPEWHFFFKESNMIHSQPAF